MTAETVTSSVTATRPPFDPELEAVLPMIRAAMPPMRPDALEESRRLMSEGLPGMPAPDLTADGRVSVVDLVVPGPEGQPDLTLLVLRRTDHATAGPAVYHTHGGGMIVGDRRSGVDMFLPFVLEHDAVVVSVEYRLAPEHPHPAPVEDCYAGLVWTAEHAEELGIDPERILIAGASAGGGLAAGAALMARDRGFPALTHQVRICPMIDDRLVTQSAQCLDGEGTWDRRDNLFGWTCLLGEERGGPDVSPYAAPARATDLAGLPRTYIDTGSVESFRDEALAYAQRLSQAGVSVDLHMWGGGFHGFDLMVPQAAISRASVAAREEFIHRALSQ
ncbi:alpha/beta hydrolase [uncultured Nocardioides sp.]|jgi:acetyl esterase/lipase|uniref:alpha/beta hydrolase n=1 Tax=uncultured Nocardioides sp. TaxID=198441 RepID=UPI000C3D70A6|nr:alpha/beta hydrolase [uncultured Nocardioides sp.]MAO82181.1 esterase [Nocardioides sp.]